MRIDFFGLFKKFTYGNTYIYNLVDYFSIYMYSYPTSRAGANDVIILFDHYLRANIKSYVMYIDTGFYFTSQKLYTYF